MRTKWASVVICGLLSLVLLLIAGCSRLPTVTLDQLMEEINAAHQQINHQGLENSFQKRKPLDESGRAISLEEQHLYFSHQPESYDPEAMLSWDQMEEDTVYLFDALYACYGNYDQMGGRDVFDAAEQAILEECSRKAPLQAEEFKTLLLSHLEFVKDSHFTIDGTDTNPSQIPFFFRETEFYKTQDNQYRTKEGKTVAAVEGYAVLDELFRRSISPEGEIVYYPVLLKDCLSTEAYAAVQVCGEQLTIHYTDGSSQVLSPEPYDLSEQLEMVDFEAVPEYQQEEEIPILQINSFMGASDLEWQAGAQEGAEILGASPIGILDLRFNPGGAGDAALEWLEDYAKIPVPTNSLFYNGFSDSETTDSRDAWVKNKNHLIILTSKRTASAAEWLVDAAYNLQNVWIVGENTSGSMRGTASDVLLENSRLTVGIGMIQAIIPSENDYFEEYRGFYPDLWVPADEAETLVMKLLETNS